MPNNKCLVCKKIFLNEDEESDAYNELTHIIVEAIETYAKNADKEELYSAIFEIVVKNK